MSSKSFDIGSRWSLLRNSSGILTSKIITLTIALVTVPVVIAHLGILGYGVWETIVAVSVLCNIVQSTISGTLLWKFSTAFGANQRDDAIAFLQAGIFTSLSFLIFIVPIAWVFRASLIAFLHIPSEFSAAAQLVLPFVVAIIGLGTVNEVIGALLSGYQQSGIVNLVQSVSSVGNSGIVVVCLLNGLGFTSLLLGSLASFLLSFVGLLACAKHYCGPVSFIPKPPSLVMIRSVKGYCGFMLFHSLAAAFRDQTDKIILAAVASPVWVGYFGVAARLSSLVWMACQFMYVPVIAAAGALFGSGNWIGLKRLYADMCVALAITVGFVSVVIAGFHDKLILLWLGHPMPEVEPVLFLLLGGSTVAIVLTGVGTALCKGIGRVRIEAYYICIGLGINLFLKATLIPAFGAFGTVVASSLSMIVSSAVFVILLHRGIPQLPFRSSFKAIMTLVMVLGLVTLARMAFPSLSVGATRMEALASLCMWVSLIAIAYFPLLLMLRVVSVATLEEVVHKLGIKLRISS